MSTHKAWRTTARTALTNNVAILTEGQPSVNVVSMNAAISERLLELGAGGAKG